MGHKITKRIRIGVAGPRNTPIGEHHPKAKLSDEEVELIRAIHEEGFLGYKAIARAFGVSKGFVRNVVKFRRRACTPDDYKTVEVEIDIEEETVLSYRDVD